MLLFFYKLILLGSSLKLTPKFALDQSTYNDLMNPCKYGIKERGVDILIDRFNYVAPEYLSLIISDGGEYPPEQIYRFFKEFYGPQELEIKPEDEDLSTILRKIKNK
jgi:translation initiation factor eIF-2B subunit beta